MKRTDLVHHLEKHGCFLLREGANHSIYLNGSRRCVSAVPRHREVNDHLARKICRDLQIPEP
jgi:predicted RNA binding protein YcfA (HicA-like mRNA interferase family)